ncbi:hypothetical protein ABVK25_001360 [Lepraria finkii]|uniref:Uncharacterized protein n=1 Tax=Lepraria finkii TaxID=1340010 RepID=A0ABR4BLF5_9LECA
MQNQYKKKLKEWKLDHKRIRLSEHKVMIRKKRKREESEKKAAFRLRDMEVDDSKIVRFRKRRKTDNQAELSDCSTPTGLSCHTPSPLVDSSIGSPMPLDCSASSVADHNPALPCFAYIVVGGRPMCKPWFDLHGPFILDSNDFGWTTFSCQLYGALATLTALQQDPVFPP